MMEVQPISVKTKTAGDAAIDGLFAGLRSSLQELPLGVLLAGHAVYGLVLGWRVYPQNHPV